MKKNASATQIVETIEDMESPIHNLKEDELLDITIKMNAIFPISYTEGEKCPSSILKYAKKIEVNDREFLSVIGASYTGSPVNCTLRVYTP